MLFLKFISTCSNTKEQGLRKAWINKLKCSSKINASIATKFDFAVLIKFIWSRYFCIWSWLVGLWSKLHGHLKWFLWENILLSLLLLSLFLVSNSNNIDEDVQVPVDEQLLSLPGDCWSKSLSLPGDCWSNLKIK